LNGECTIVLKKNYKRARDGPTQRGPKGRNLLKERTGFEGGSPPPPGKGGKKRPLQKKKCRQR